MHKSKEDRTTEFVNYLYREYGEDTSSFYDFEIDVINYLNKIHEDYKHNITWKQTNLLQAR